MKYWKYYLLAIVIIGIDQASKLLVHYNMELGVAGEVYVLGEWFRLHYLLNPGMAFGIELDFLFGDYAKLYLTVFRLLASFGIGYAIYSLARKKAHPGLLVCIALILGGAIGNVIDSIFYGVFIEGNMIKGAPTPWFHGQVIDMLYFPMVEGYFPEWIPQIGGDYFLFFSPVFNIADSSIFVGVTTVLIFQKRFSLEEPVQVAEEKRETIEEEVETTKTSEKNESTFSVPDGHEANEGEKRLPDSEEKNESAG